MLRLALLALALLSLPAAAGGPFASFDAASAPVLSNPHDLVIGPDGRLYVADLGHDRIAVMDPQTLEVTGEIGAGQLSGPHDVAFDARGRMLVADTNNDRIAIFEGGRLVAALTEGLSRPEGVVEHPNGRIYATGAGNGRAVAYRDGAVVARLGGLLRPHDLEIDAAGDLWIADSGNDRMLKVSAELEVLAVLDDPAYGWSGPRYLDLDPAGNLVVADKYSHRVKRIAPDGAMTGALGAEAGLGPGLFRTPEGVEVRDDTLWFSDSGNDRVVRYRVLTN